MDRASRGELITITKAGRRVAELRALPQPGLAAAALLERWHHLPLVDPVAMRRDVDRLVDPSL